MLETLNRCCQGQLLSAVLEQHPSMQQKRPSGNFWFHAMASRQEAVSPAMWRKAYKFGIVRNPWDRQVSNFNFLMETWANCRAAPEQSAFCKKMAQRLLPDFYREWKDNPAEVRFQFQAWVHRLHQAHPVGSKQEFQFSSLAHGNDEEAHFNASQSSWFSDAQGRMMVQDIVKLEELNQEWPRLSKQICAPPGTTVSHRNSREHAHYSSFYDDATIEIVRKYSEPDIRRWGYKFERSTSNFKIP